LPREIIAEIDEITESEMNSRSSVIRRFIAESLRKIREVSDIFVEVSKKFFGIEESEITGVWR